MFDILIKTLKTGRVTTKYPEKPDIAPSGFRGKPELFADKCIYCGECVKSCPPGVIWLTKENGGTALSLSICGCIFCGRCEEVCQKGAVVLSREYETASKTKEDLISIIRRTS